MVVTPPKRAHGSCHSPEPLVRCLPRVTWSSFELFFGGVIFLNACVLVIETDYRPATGGLGWFISDSLFTILFTAELAIRVALLRCKWWYSLWNLFDGFLVLTSILDVWILPVIDFEKMDMRMLSLLRVLRLMRMMRVLRVLRLFQFAHQLVLLVHALWGALRTIAWAGLLVAIVIYIFGMLITRLVGKKCCSADDPFQDPRILDWFGTMPRSLFTLFQLMTLEGWPDIARITLDDNPWLTMFYVCFIMLTNVTLLNTVAGVLTENVLTASRTDQLEQELEQERTIEDEILLVGASLAEIDHDGDGMLGFDELREGHSTADHQLGRFLRLAGLSSQDAEDIFHVCDYEGQGRIAREDFVDGVRRSRGPIKAKHLLGLRRDILQFERKFANLSDVLEKISGRAATLTEEIRRNQALQMRALEGAGASGPDRATSEYNQAVSGGITALRQDFRERLAQVEARLSGKLQFALSTTSPRSGSGTAGPRPS